MEVTDENQRVVVPKYSLGALVSSLVDKVSHQFSDTINSRTVLCKNEATNPVTIYISV